MIMIKGIIITITIKREIEKLFLNQIKVFIIQQEIVPLN